MQKKWELYNGIWRDARDAKNGKNPGKSDNTVKDAARRWIKGHLGIGDDGIFKSVLSVRMSGAINKVATSASWIIFLGSFKIYSSLKFMVQFTE